ncbi:MAG: sigma-54-dependent Fis family transcriptional regulator [Xanthomonadales bacterium]|nr:Regulatory protein AtoC [Xanthomonadales bacterium]MCC6592154.1 sigma-54-dependent Fis family transcriptional regulator [Xanthomonadales bacterium]MCE7931150.1 sigma-54-dependent Fis family transcriptional regulator [Xanthomonadales bacterium PRO6]
MPAILIIDDNPAIGTALELLLGLDGHTVSTAQSPRVGLDILAREPVDLVIQDMNFSADTTSGEEGVVLFRQIRERHPDLPVILLTAWTHLEQAVGLVKAGAADYLSKPWDDARLLTTVRNLLELAESNRQARKLVARESEGRRSLAREYDLRGMVYAAPAMERVLRLACQVARADVPVLITGPNGAGKERIAEIIHANSRVKDGPFVAVNCGALPADLLEAELFGAEAGAYTGAGKAREGRFEAADGGTLFLDEIGNLSPAGQMKLLRVLETGRFERLGSNRTREVKVRVLSATNADLAAMIRRGDFREDLYYRLNVIEVRLPPLAERREDIVPLAEHFLAGQARLSDGARRALEAHAWPGNVRELKNALTRASLLCRDGVVQADDLGLPAAPATAAAADNALREPSRDEIEAALARAGGVVAEAALSLGLSRQALYRRMEKYAIGVRRE